MGGSIAAAVKAFPPASSTVAACPIKKLSATCAKLADARNKAIMSSDVYGSDPRLASTGYTKLDPNTAEGRAALDKLGITDPKEALSPDGSSFRAAIYQKTLPDGTHDTVVAFRGTQTGADWRENVAQASGMRNADDPSSNASYARATRLAKIVSANAEEEGDAVSFAGHSLGGGLASAAAAKTGLPASTFNASGLNARTLGGLPVPPAPVDAYYSPTDPLSKLQDSRVGVLSTLTGLAGMVPVVGPALSGGLAGWILGNEAGGTPVVPKAYGARHLLPFPSDQARPGLNLLRAHGMDIVIGGVEEQQRAQGCPT